MAKPTDLVQGTLDLLILKTLALQPMHGWGIAQRIRQVSKAHLHGAGIAVDDWRGAPKNEVRITRGMK
jgi:hypothetical protein